MSNDNTTQSPLVYNGEVINQREQMVSLTDMWRAAGSPANMEPYNWARKEGASFVAAVTVTHNLPDSQVMTKKRGKSGATFAHWQIALAYAKYLNHEFHMWCNTVVRERMEGRSVSVGVLPPEVLELIRRTDGIARMLSRKMTEVERKIEMSVADGVTAGEVCDLAKVATSYPRGISGRVSRRLSQFCARHGETPRISRLGRVRAQLFPTHLVREWLDVEGRSLIVRWIEDRRGQGSLRLITSGKHPKG